MQPLAGTVALLMTQVSQSRFEVWYVLLASFTLRYSNMVMDNPPLIVDFHINTLYHKGDFQLVCLIAGWYS
jgi:hypothetical protein